MQIQRLPTRKLFYKKWPIKIECIIKNAGNLARLGVAATEKLIAQQSQTPVRYGIRNYDTTELKQFIDAYRPFADKDIKVRCEGSHFNIFLKDKKLCEDIIVALGNWIVRVTEPANDEELNFLISQTGRKIICDVFPKGKYRYRIYIKPSMKSDIRMRFYEWMTKYNDKFDVAFSTRAWLTGGRYYTQDPFFYVEDSPMLSMAGMYLGNNVQRVEEFIPRNVINTECPT